MATTLRRNPTRNRSAPKRFEDEKFVSGAIDRYQQCYDANRVGKYDDINGDENYYTTRDGRKFATFTWNSNNTIYRYTMRDFAESVLEFTSIWRDMGMVLSGVLVSNISSFLKISDIDQALIADDDEFVVGDEELEDKEEEVSEEEWNSDEETDDDGEWSEYSDED